VFREMSELVRKYCREQVANGGLRVVKSTEHHPENIYTVRRVGS